MGIFDIFKRQPPVDKAKAFKDTVVDDVFVETAKTFNGRPNPFENLKPTDEQSEQAKAEARRAREASDKANAERKLEAAKDAEWIEVGTQDGTWGNVKKAE